MVAPPGRGTANPIRLIGRYTRWLHTRWPAGTVETFPVADAEGRTRVPGLFVTGDLTGVPLLKFALDSGARAARTIARELEGKPRAEGVLDVAIVGAGVSGMAAALEAGKLGLSARVYESAEPFFTVANFPRRKPIFTYPRSMVPAGNLQVRADVKEALLQELRDQAAASGIVPERARIDRVARRGSDFVLEPDGGPAVRARRVIVAIGRSGDVRRLGVPGEERDKVMNRLHDPRDFAGKDVLVVGGGDAALEAAIALVRGGARVTLAHRGSELVRPKRENVETVRALAAGMDPAEARVEHPVSERVAAVDDFAPPGPSGGSLALVPASTVQEIGDADVLLATPGGSRRIPNDAVFVLIGRTVPLDFFRRSGVALRGEWTPRTWAGLAFILLAALVVYHWKTDAGIPIQAWFKARNWFPFQLPAGASPETLLGTLRISLRQPGFYYSLAYSVLVAAFGIRRIRRRRTPYVTAQTSTLIAIQVLPLFLLPYILLPWAGHQGWFDAGAGKAFADAFFPVSSWDPQGREYWRAVGFILAWPLMFWNVFTHEPMAAWLAVSAIQTFVLIPALVFFWGKGAYCGWICSCGALAETVGDTLRHKMPHGPGWNRLNMTGQAVLGVACILLVLRIASWAAPEGSAIDRALTAAYMAAFLGKDGSWQNLPFPWTFLNYNWLVDLTLAGILGVGLYVHLSGRVWCRFACPLAALMHIYARGSRFRILAEKRKCISCNVCTSVCHQGIDVMNFANKGIPLDDPQCVRCSACVQSCPTGVLAFGRVNRAGEVTAVDRLVASPVRARETESP